MFFSASPVPSIAQLMAWLALSGLSKPVRWLLNAYNLPSAMITAWELTEPMSTPALMMSASFQSMPSSCQRYSFQRQNSFFVSLKVCAS